MYKSHQCLFLLDESDTLQAYEARAPPLISDHDATMMAALDSMDRVQQMEVVHREFTFQVHLLIIHLCIIILLRVQ